MSDNLYCVGCGNSIAKEVPGHTLAISCRCGADSPILAREDGSGYGLPYSLVNPRRAEGQKAHLERYLGFSDHESALKAEWREALVNRNYTPMVECPEAQCREYVARKKSEEGVSNGKRSH